MTIRSITARGDHAAGPEAADDGRATLEYLTALHGRGDGLCEIRFRRVAGGMGQLFFDARELEDAARVVVGLGGRTDCYVGVASRRTSCGRRTALDHAATVWADCDTAAAVARLGLRVPPPSLVVRSGSTHGRHAYWLLATPLPVEAIESINRRLALALGADGRCADAARVLRPPATKNFKYRPPASVRLEVCNAGCRYDAATLTAALPELRAPAPVRLPPRSGAQDPLRDIAPAAYVRVLLGVEVGRSRKIRCPFHDDHTPSLHVYPTPEQGWYCFGCGRGTSIYDMAAAVWGLGTRGAEFVALRDRLRARFGCERG